MLTKAVFIFNLKYKNKKYSKTVILWNIIKNENNNN